MQENGRLPLYSFAFFSSLSCVVDAVVFLNASAVYAFSARKHLVVLITIRYVSVRPWKIRLNF